MSELIGALDQGTTSTRFMIFDHGGEVVSVDQQEHRQIFPRPGWVEHDPIEIWSTTIAVIEGALSRKGLTASDLMAVGLTNQRETTVIWDRRSEERRRAEDGTPRNRRQRDRRTRRTADDEIRRAGYVFLTVE